MPRKKRIFKKKEILPDELYNSTLISKFINILMKHGKKSLAERILYKSFELIRKETNENPLDVFRKAIENVKPLIEVKSRRVGGANYQIPVEIPLERRLILSFRWIVEFSRKRKGSNMTKSLYEEVLEASKNKGNAVKKKENIHKMAEANKVFSHYKW